MRHARQSARLGVAVLFVASLLVVSALPRSVSAATGESRIKHIIVMVQENHMFDNYFGTYPGVNGLYNATAMPTALGEAPTVEPYLLKSPVLISNLTNSWDAAHEAYDNGTMDGFIAAQDGSNVTMGYYDYHLIPYYWDYASQYVLMDNFFTSVMGPSLPNRVYLVAGQSGGLTVDSRYGAMNFNSSTVKDNMFEFSSAVNELEADGVSWRYYAGDYTVLNN